MKTTAQIDAASNAATPSGSAAVLALKPLLRAKSRVDSVVPELRQQLAWAMALDTLTCLASVVDHVVVVSDQPDLDTTFSHLGLALEVVPEPAGGGLNPALRHGATILRGQGFGRIVACVGDLPALHARSLGRVLETAQRDGRSFVSDASGVGTTMLIADQTDLDPRFQGSSTAAHQASGALALTDRELGTSIPDARRDVDTEADLVEAYDLGLGRHTEALIDPATGHLGRYSTITMEPASLGTDLNSAVVSPSRSVTVITTEGLRLPMGPSAWTQLPPQILVEQRLHAVLADDRVLSAWL